jgi:hypothetical protein
MLDLNEAIVLPLLEFRCTRQRLPAPCFVGIWST